MRKSRSKRWLRFMSLLVLGAFLFTAAGSVTGTAYGQTAEDNSAEITPDESAFSSLWDKTDSVIYGGISRTWLWGPGVNITVPEAYGGGVRLVQYYDKSRMEVNNTGGDKNSPWYVTNGLLAKELITGDMQLADDQFANYPASQIPVAGDPDDTNAPTYAALAGLISRFPGNNPAGRDLNAYINTQRDRDGNNSTGNLGQIYGVRNGYYEPLTSHNLAGPFWDYLNSSGLLKTQNRLVNARLFDPLYFATGLPLSEAFWVKSKVAGEVKDVLVQVFERRVLTYTPSNPKGWQVEMGNIGQHYFRWRYIEVPRYLTDNRFGVIFTGDMRSDALSAQLDLLGGKRPWYTFNNQGISSSLSANSTDTSNSQSRSGGQQVLMVRTGKGAPNDATIKSLVQKAPKGSSYFIGNEPNVPGQDDVAPATYAAQYERLKNTIKGIDPTAKLVGPNILNWNYTCTDCPGYTQGDQWMSDMLAAYKQLTGHDFDADALGIHTYGIDWTRLPMVDWRKDLDQLKGLRKFLDDRGWHHRPIWCTEFGILWGYKKTTYYLDANGNTRIKPDGPYQTYAVLNYILNYTLWLQNNGDDYNIGRWFVYTGFGSPEPYSDVYGGINLFTGTDKTSDLTIFGQAYRLLSSFRFRD